VIVISGALVLVALVLLIVGVVAPELNYVYASIIVSLASGIFLLVGIVQRRRTPASAKTPAPDETTQKDAAAPAKGDAAADDIAPVTVALPASSPRPARAREPETGSVAIATAEPEAPAAEQFDDDEELAGYVLVVPGRPRYHIDGCRYIAGKDVEELDVRDARDEGFTACGVCQPDEALEQEYGEVEQPQRSGSAPVGGRPAAKQQYDDQQYDDDGYDDDGYDDQYDELDAADVPVVEPAAVPAKRPARPAAAPASPKKQVASVRIPSTPAPATAPSRAQAPSRAPAPSRAAASSRAAAPGRAAAPASGRAGGTRTVVVIPELGTFHNSGCRYVRGVDGAYDQSRDNAVGEGYEPCGVCRP